MNSFMQAKNAEDMADLLRDKEVIFAFNGVVNPDTLAEDWIFWFGNNALGVESYHIKLNKPRTMVVPASPLFELAAINRMSISDFARPATGVTISNFTKELFEKYRNDKEEYLKKLKEFRRHKAAKDFIDSFLEDIKKEL